MNLDLFKSIGNSIAGIDPSLVDEERIERGRQENIRNLVKEAFKESPSGRARLGAILGLERQGISRADINYHLSTPDSVFYAEDPAKAKLIYDTMGDKSGRARLGAISALENAGVTRQDILDAGYSVDVAAGSGGLLENLQDAVTSVGQGARGFVNDAGELVRDVPGIVADAAVDITAPAVDLIDRNITQPIADEVDRLGARIEENVTSPIVDEAGRFADNLREEGRRINEDVNAEVERLPENLDKYVATPLENAATGLLGGISDALGGGSGGGINAAQRQWNLDRIADLESQGARAEASAIDQFNLGRGDQRRLYNAAIDTLRQPIAQQIQGINQARTDAINALQRGENLGVGATQRGLTGAESIYGGSRDAAINDLTRGFAQARGDVYGQTAEGIRDLKGMLAGSQALGGQALGQLGSARAGAQQAIGRGVADLQGSEARGLGRLDTAFDQAVAPIQQFVDPGVQAQQQQAALSGALGAEAQQQAFNEFTQSPGQRFAQQRQEQALLRNAAALGGLGGGRVRTALQEQAAGFAQQDFDNQFNRLGQLAQQGLGAAGQVGSLRGTQGTSAANLIGQMGQARGNLQGQMAGIESSLGQAGANVLSKMASDQLGAGRDLLSARQSLGGQLADIATGGAGATAGVRTGMGELIGGARIGAGRDLSDIYTGTAGQVAGARERAGYGVSDILGGQARGIAGLQQGLGDSQVAQRGDLTNVLSRLITTPGIQAAGMPSGAVQQRDKLDRTIQLLGGLGGFLGAF